MPLYIEPYAGAAPVVSVINAAQHEVDVAVYYLGSRRIVAALSRAEQRGVEVRVMVDGKPYEIKPWMVRNELNALINSHISVKLPPRRFDSRWLFMHCKYVVTGHQAMIGTANFDHAAFTKNREYLLVTSAPQVVHALQTVFNADWNRVRAGSGPRQILDMSPGATPDIMQVIDQPGAILVETEEMGDDYRVLHALEQKGKNAKVIVPSTESASDRKNLHQLASYGVQIRYLPANIAYLHAKAVYGINMSFIGSENFSPTSLDKNREIGITLVSKQFPALKRQMDNDWSEATNIPRNAGPLDKAKAAFHKWF